MPATVHAPADPRCEAALQPADELAPLECSSKCLIADVAVEAAPEWKDDGSLPLDSEGQL